MDSLETPIALQKLADPRLKEWQAISLGPPSTERKQLRMRLINFSGERTLKGEGGAI